jgi:hypothetical protein
MEIDLKGIIINEKVIVTADTRSHISINQE